MFNDLHAEITLQRDRDMGVSNLSEIDYYDKTSKANPIDNDNNKTGEKKDIDTKYTEDLTCESIVPKETDLLLEPTVHNNNNNNKKKKNNNNNNNDDSDDENIHISHQPSDETPPIPLSMVSDVEKACFKLYSQYKITFYINLMFLLLYLLIFSVSIVIYVKYETICPDMQNFGELTMVITVYLVFCYLFSTICACVNWQHGKKIMKKSKGKKRKTPKMVTKTVSQTVYDDYSKKASEIESYIHSLLVETKKKKKTSLVNILRIGNLISNKTLLYSSLSELIKTNTKPPTKPNGAEMEEAIYDVRKTMVPFSNTVHKSRKRSNSNFQLFLVSVYTLPILSLMFWITSGVGGIKHGIDFETDCGIPFAYYWIITILVTLLSFVELVPVFIRFITNTSLF
jgi:hypothetical protein